MEIEIKIIKKNDYLFLYDLLAKRESIFNISHKKMPTYKEHLKFISSKPYSKWYIVYHNKVRVGSIYLSKQNEIGMHFKKDFSFDEIRKEVLKLLMKKNPKIRYLVNINPKNKKLIQFFKNNGFKLIQHTYELEN